MKCFACGYRYKEMEDENFCDDFVEVSDGKEEFGKIDETYALRTSKDHYSNYTKMKMYVCPRCGTVRMEKFE